MAATFARSAFRAPLQINRRLATATSNSSFAQRPAARILRRSLATEQPRLRLGTTAPNFQAKTTHGDIDFHQWLGGSWAILFSHPADFTPVCTTELGAFAKLRGEFEKRQVKMIGLVSYLWAILGLIHDIHTTINIHCGCLHLALCAIV
jgi:peroxiredoxin (alkyl hydroperoxide reductase subunit C)